MSKADTTGQRFVIGEFLSEWPAKWSYDAITAALVDEKKCVSQIQDFENWTGMQMFQFMDALAKDIDRLLEIKRRETLDEVIVKLGDMAKK